MLQVRYKNSDKRPLWLVDEQYSIGSGSDCDIPIQDKSVAAHQASLNVTTDSVFINNLGPAGLVSVNGESLAQKAPLKHGDEVVVGSVALEFVDPKLLREAVTEKPSTTEPRIETLWSLKALNTALANKQFPIDREVTLGRSNECDVTLGVAHLSRRHAVLRILGDLLEVEDLRSSNGTYVNGKQVEKALLKDGDELSFDTLSFRVSGPPDDSESTMLRGPQADVDKTTIRPAIKVPPVGAAPKSRAGVQKPQAPGSNPRTKTQSVPAAQTNEGSSTGLVIAVVVAVIVIAGAAWFILG